MAEGDGRRRGYEDRGTPVCPLCRSPGRPPRPGRRTVVVVEGGEGLRAVLVAELKGALAGRRVRVRGASPGAILQAPRDPAGSRLHVGLPSVCQRLAACPRRAVPMEPLAVRGGRSELRRIAGLRPGSVVAVLTVSRRVRAYARELLAGWPDLALAAPRPDDSPALARALRVADLVWVDASFRGRPVSDGDLGKERARLLRCIRSDSLARVAIRVGLSDHGSPGVPGRSSARSEGGRTRCATRSYRPA